MNPISKAWWIAKGVGWDNVPRRLYQSAAIRSGVLRRKLNPAKYAWTEFRGNSTTQSKRVSQWQERKLRFLPIPSQSQLKAIVSEEQWDASVLQVCRRALDGKYLMFSRWEGQLGWPPNFNRDPMHSIDWPTGVHWMDSAKSGPPRNDIKLVWEASRFSLGFYFARAYRYTENECWAEAFWQMLDAWIDQNPVNESVAWGCGQEIAFRLMAMLTGAFATLDSPSAKPQRLERLEFLCWQSAKRIATNINYAISQENNHGLSEAIGLWTVGLLFPEFPESAKWVECAERLLRSEISRQVYEDGSYVQHSMSYHRVMLDDMSWAVALGRRNDRNFNGELEDRVRKAVDWLAQFVDPGNGRVPNYGANDGANVLPLSCSDYLDYRPTLQAAGTLFGCSTGMPPLGTWSEKTLWLCGNETLKPSSTPIQRQLASSWTAPTGGYHILRGPNSYLMTRATEFRDRPSQCDMLHVDLWMRGHNIFRDAGSFRYYHEEPELKKFFYSVEAHNAVQVANQEQMQKGSNFLWFRWPKGFAEFECDGTLSCRASFEYANSYTHHRTINRNGDSYRIEDSVKGSDRFTLRWHLAPEFLWYAIEPTVYVAQITSTERILLRLDGTGENAPTLLRGWESLYYGERREIPVIVVPDAQGTIVTSVEWILESEHGNDGSNNNR